MPLLADEKVVNLSSGEHLPVRIRWWAAETARLTGFRITTIRRASGYIEPRFRWTSGR